MAVTGAHVLLYTEEAEKLRQIFKEVFKWEYVDTGDDWLIFALPPAEIAAHPSDGGPPIHSMSLTCDDINSTIDELKSKGIEFKGGTEDQGWGITTTMALPGGVEVMLYQPRHEMAAKP